MCVCVYICRYSPQAQASSSYTSPPWPSRLPPRQTQQPRCGIGGGAVFMCVCVYVYVCVREQGQRAMRMCPSLDVAVEKTRGAHIHTHTHTDTYLPDPYTLRCLIPRHHQPSLISTSQEVRNGGPRKLSSGHGGGVCGCVCVCVWRGGGKEEVRL